MRGERGSGGEGGNMLSSRTGNAEVRFRRDDREQTSREQLQKGIYKVEKNMMGPEHEAQTQSEAHTILRSAKTASWDGKEVERRRRFLWGENHKGRGQTDRSTAESHYASKKADNSAKRGRGKQWRS